MRNNYIDPFIKQQALEKMLSKCPMCAASKKLMQLNVLRQTAEAELVYIQCKSCHSSVVALIVSSGSLISSIGLITDLTKDDVSKFQHCSALNTDDLIELHETLYQPDICREILKIK